MNLKQAIAKFRKLNFETAALCLEKRTEEEWRKCTLDGNFGNMPESKNNLITWLQSCFSWTRSTEGFVFWCQICEQLLKLESEKDSIEDSSPMLMTKKTPDKPGVYWWQLRKKTKMYLIRVCKDKSKNCLYGFLLFAEEIELNDYDFSYIPLNEIPGYWSNKAIERPKGYK